MIDYFYYISIVYFFLPAYFANMAPPLSAKAGLLDFLAKPVDGGRKYKGRDIFGNHKTWRGIFFALLVSFTIVMLQGAFYQNLFIQKISFIDYSKINLPLFGLLISFGAVAGDLAFAFIKRRMSLDPGAKFMPWDQINYVIGALVFLQPLLRFDSKIWLWLFVLTFFLHILFNRLGYWLGLHKAKW